MAGVAGCLAGVRKKSVTIDSEGTSAHQLGTRPGLPVRPPSPHLAVGRPISASHKDGVDDFSFQKQLSIKTDHQDARRHATQFSGPVFTLDREQRCDELERLIARKIVARTRPHHSTHVLADCGVCTRLRGKAVDSRLDSSK